ncbi:hypothetical protein [Ignavibacterium sp.]|uniref:hypothetical protein n=1 Tax=Ignavibacterium sp. TaxID=2651167 RepID=UPI00307D3FBD
MPVLSNIKLEFKEYPGGSWTDWSEYLINSPAVSKKIESNNPGEPGAVVFDSVKLFLRYETGSPVYQKFSIDLSSIQRYLFKVSFLDNSLNYVVKFVGQGDFSTIEWNEYNNIISFTVVDKLASISLIPSIPARGQRLLWERVLGQVSWATFIDFNYNTNVLDQIWITVGHPDVYDDLTDLLVYPGEVLDIPEITTSISRLRVVKQSWLEVHPIYNKVANRVVFSPPLDGSVYNVVRYYIEDRPTVDPVIYESNIYGQDCNVYEGDELKAYDGLKIIRGIYQTVWPTDIFNIIPNDLVFNLPAEYGTMFLNEQPMNKTMLDALITLINSIKPSTAALSGAYITTDETTATIIAKENISDAGILRTIGSTKILSFRKRHFWDKLADGAKVVLKSWVIDKASGKLKDYVGEALKQIIGYPGKIKPRNEVKKEIITTQNYSGNVDEFYSNLANTEASLLLDFYGKRREKLNIGLDLDNNTINWDLIDRLNYDGKEYFFTNLSISDKSITLEAVEIQGHDYDIRQVLISPSTTSIDSDGGTIQIIQGNNISPDYYFTSPLELLNNTVSIKYSNNLKITDNKLDTIQDIAITSNPTFTQLILSNPGTSTTNAVRGDRSINTSSPLTGGGNLTADRTIGFSYNTTNLKLTSNQLNTIQDIAVTSNPTFTQLILSNPGTSTTNAVRGDRSINTSSPLTGGGNLTANRTLGLSYSTTNLKLTSNQLNTIQDIATTSSPQFEGVTARYISGAYISQNHWTNGTIGSMNAIGLPINRLLGANKGRYTVTATGFSGGAIDPLFDGTYETSVNVPANGTASVEIDFNPQLGWTPNTASGYAYISSIFILTAFYTVFESVKLEAYRYNTATQQDEWSLVFDITNNTKNPFVYNIPGMYYFTKKLRVTVVNSTSTTKPLTEIEWFPSREESFRNVNNFSVCPRIFNVYPFDVQYSNLVFKNSSWQDVINILGNGNIKFYNGNKQIGSGDNNNFSIISNNSERITVRNDGNIGVNQSNPSYKLDVNGTARITQDLTLSALLKQQGTTGTNDFSADINQTGNKSIYNTFTSGWTGSGWRVDYGITAANRSHLELDDLTVRGTMRVYELIINQIRATNGSLFVSSSAKVEAVTRVTDDPVIYTIIFEDPEGHGVCPFLIDDIIIVQRVRLDSTTIVKQIVCQVTNVTGKTVTALVIYENGQITKGDLVVRIGNVNNTNRQGSVYLTSDDSNAPYIDIVDGVNSWIAWGSSNKLKARLGKLTGVTDSFFGTLSGYGLYAKSNAYLRGKIYAEAGGWLAGWSINSNSLTSPLIASNHQIALIADDTNNITGAYANINLGGANPLYISFGRIKTSLSSYSNNYGLSAKDETGSDFFELSNNIKHIAGWNFDTQKFYKGTSIELNSNTNSIGVNSNKVKVFYTDVSNWGIEGIDGLGNLVFQLGSTNKIAGWTFNNEHIYKLTSGTPTSSPVYGLTMSATSTASVVIAYGSNYQRYVKFGYQTSGNWFGVEGTDSNANIVFQLGSTNKISGWNFDTTKFSNGVVSLEASASMKGLVVDTDKIKVGSFTATGISSSYSNISSQITNGYFNPTIRSDDAGWSILGSYYINNIPYPPSMLKENNLIKCVIENEVNSWDYRLVHRMFNHEDYVLGKRLKIEFQVEFNAGSENLGYSGGTFQFAIRYYNSGWGTVYRQVLYEELIEDNRAGYIIDKTGTNGIEFDLPANIPNTATVYVEWGFGGGGQTGLYYPYNMLLTDLIFYGYLNYKTWINEKGIQLYNSPTNYIKLYDTAAELNVPILKQRGIPLIRNHGRLATAPTQDVEIGDIYINSSNNNIYLCYDINSSGEPQWKQLG